MKRKILLIASTVLILGLFNAQVLRTDPLLNGGTTMYLRLAPVDPRAFLLGDYMALDYLLDQDIQRAVRTAPPTGKHEGLAVVRLSENAEALFVRLDDGSPLAENEHLLSFRIKNGRARAAAESFFFQEGFAYDYEQAAFGEIHVAPDGSHLLTHLLDDQMQRIEPLKKQQESVQ